MSTGLKPIKFRVWSDYYTLGAFCQKTNLIRYALQNCSLLSNDPDKKRLFYRGVADAYQSSFADLAFSISRIRSENPAEFDKKIYECAGIAVAREIQEAVKAAPADWQTEKQMKVGQEITQEMTNSRKDYWAFKGDEQEEMIG